MYKYVSQMVLFIKMSHTIFHKTSYLYMENNQNVERQNENFPALSRQGKVGALSVCFSVLCIKPKSQISAFIV